MSSIPSSDSSQSFPNHLAPTSQTYNRNRYYLSCKIDGSKTIEPVFLCVQRPSYICKSQHGTVDPSLSSPIVSLMNRVHLNI